MWSSLSFWRLMLTGVGLKLVKYRGGQSSTAVVVVITLLLLLLLLVYISAVVVTHSFTGVLEDTEASRLLLALGPISRVWRLTPDCGQRRAEQMRHWGQCGGWGGACEYKSKPEICVGSQIKYPPPLSDKFLHYRIFKGILQKRGQFTLWAVKKQQKKEAN